MDFDLTPFFIARKVCGCRTRIELNLKDLSIFKLLMLLCVEQQVA